MIGYSLPTVGFGVYLLEASLCAGAVANALKTGYRCGKGPWRPKLTLITHEIAMLSGISIVRSTMRMRQKSVKVSVSLGFHVNKSSSVCDIWSCVLLVESDMLEKSFKGPQCGLWV